MSVAQLPAAPLSVDLAEAAGRDEKVIFHCMRCQRSRDANAAIFLGLLGPVPFGMLIGKLKCTRCLEKLAVLLPWYAPTPATWVKQYKPPELREERRALEPWDFAFQVDSWGKSDNAHYGTTTATSRMAVAHFAFEYELKEIRPDDRFTLRSKTLLIRDSGRDLKVVADDGRKLAPFDPKTIGHSTHGKD